MFLKYIERGWYIFALWACRMFCVVFFRMHMFGQDNIPRKGPFILIRNHQSTLDPIFIGAPIPRQLAYVARDTLFGNWFFRNLCVSVGTITVRRGTADMTAIRRMLARLKEGLGLVLFPEATRTSDGKISPLKPGFALLSRRAKAPIVPVIIDGAYECWPRTRKFFTPWMHVSVTYGTSIPAEEIAKMTDEQVTDKLNEILRQMHNQARKRMKKTLYDYKPVMSDKCETKGE